MSILKYLRLSASIHESEQQSKAREYHNRTQESLEAPTSPRSAVTRLNEEDTFHVHSSLLCSSICASYRFVGVMALVTIGQR